ncbi:MAG: class I SAM-dependent methyltransferase [Streptosporangiales bacterium]|nr:class I SAM-dependent methyltransferase [Streptosporangiales bacterium]
MRTIPALSGPMTNMLGAGQPGGTAMKRALAGAAALAAAGAAAAWWWYEAAPYPYSHRWMLNRQVPFLTNRRIDALLAARPGERILEIGCGTGLQTLNVAAQVGEQGRLDIVDVQQQMLDHVMEQAKEREMTQVVPSLADATALPFEDNSFDAAYIITALGEIPDSAATVRELGRVLKPGGRLVVGECFERHFVSYVTLLHYANDAGLAPTVTLGPPAAYLAQFRAR